MMNYLEKKKKAMLNYVSGGRLPSEYQEVEWVSNNNTYSYFQLPFNYQDNHTFEVYLDFQNNANKSNGAYFGWNNGGRLLSTGNNTNYLGNGVSNFNNGSYAWNDRQIVITEIKTTSPKTTNYYDENYNLLNTRNNSRYNNENFGVFIDGTFKSNYCNAKFYQFKVTIDGVLNYDLVPCYRKADNVIGMYDIVNDVFYTNAGSGTFTKGQDV